MRGQCTGQWIRTISIVSFLRIPDLLVAKSKFSNETKEKKNRRKIPNRSKPISNFVLFPIFIVQPNVYTYILSVAHENFHWNNNNRVVTEMEHWPIQFLLDVFCINMFLGVFTIDRQIFHKIVNCESVYVCECHLEICLV